MRINSRGQEGAGQEVLHESEGGGEKRRRQEPPESKPRAKGQVEGRTQSSEGTPADSISVPVPAVHFPGDGDILPVPWRPDKSIALRAGLTTDQANRVGSASLVPLEFSLMKYSGWGPGQSPGHLVIRD